MIGARLVVGAGAGTGFGVGALLAATTAIANAGRLTVLRPSVTVMRMLSYVPTLLLPGVPVRVPVRDAKLAQSGLPRIQKKRRVLRPPVTLGVNW